MKKFYFSFLCIVYSVTTIAQIAPIKTYGDPEEMLGISEGVYLYRNKATNNYTMWLYSDNEYEDQVATFSLGKGAQQALRSIINLRETIKQSGVNFDLQGYTFKTTGGEAYIIGGPSMQYTAGQYSVHDYEMDQCILCLLYKMNKTEECEFFVSRAYKDQIVLGLKIPKYNITCGTYSLRVVANRYGVVFPEVLTINNNDTLTESQKMALKEGLESKKLTWTYGYNSWEALSDSQFVKLMANKMLGIEND